MSASELQTTTKWRRELLRRRVRFQIEDIVVLQAIQRAVNPVPGGRHTMKIEGLPEGCDLIGCWPDPITRCFDFIAVHESFAEVQDFSMPPVLPVRYQFIGVPADQSAEIAALKIERDRLRSLLGRLCMAETPEEARKMMIELTQEMPESEDVELAIEALKELAGGAA